ncbi:MAG: YigZ family protein [Dysgonamonadaceae bacterium]
MEEDVFRTVVGSADGLITEKKSKFLSFIHHVESAEKAKEIVDECRKKYYDARHVCWAYMLGWQRDDYRSNDDGEPSGTAGRPILGQINSHELTDVIVLVVRYFGGTLLGTSGLIKAYKEATAEAIANAEIIEKTVDEGVVIHFDYQLLNDVMRVLKQFESVHWEQDFKESCIMRLMIRKSQIDLLTSTLRAIYGVEVKSLNQIDKK